MYFSILIYREGKGRPTAFKVEEDMIWLFMKVKRLQGKRANFSSIQASQVVPTGNYQVTRLRTTYEKVVPHLSKLPFCYMAEEDGIVVEIDDKINMIKIEYKSGKRIALEYGKLMSRYSAAGLYITQNIAIHTKVQQNMKFNKNEPIVFNDNYFQEDPFSNGIIWMFGCRAKVAITDTDGTIDDSNMLSKKLSNKLNFEPVHDRQIVLSKDYVIHSFMDVGAKVSSITPLLIFEESADIFDYSLYDEETVNLIQKLNRKTPKAQSTGVISDIKVLYTSPINTMSESMQKFIRHVEKKSNKQASFSSETSNPVAPNIPITNTDKVGLVDLDSDTIIITYYIRDDYSSRTGDKVVFGTSLKSVTSYVYEDPIYTEDGTEIEAFFASLSIYNRIINSPIITGTASLVLEKLQNDIIEIYFNER